MGAARLALAALTGAAVVVVARAVRRFCALPRGRQWRPRAELAAGKVEVGDLTLNKVFLMNDANYPAWLVLVPRQDGLREVFDLPPVLREQLWEEVHACCKVVQEAFAPYKLNIAAIGNVVDQLHIHITGRTKNDPSWPGPCYGAVPAVPLAADALHEAVQKLRAGLAAKHVLLTAAAST